MMLNVREFGARLWLGLLCWVVCFTGCGGKLAPSFEGVFVHSASSEFSQAADTLRVEKTGELDYVIYRSTGIVLISEDGKKASPVLERETWKLEYDEVKSVLVERSKGRHLSLEGEGLSLENAVYKRLP